MSRKRNTRQTAHIPSDQERRRRNALEKTEQPGIPTSTILPLTVGQSHSTITVSAMASYLSKYIEKYREEYRRFVTPLPYGRGYPDLSISPYLYSNNLTVNLASDGFFIWDGWDLDKVPKPYIVNVPEWRTEPEIKAQSGRHGTVLLIGDNALQPGAVRSGRLPEPSDSLETTVAGTVSLKVFRYELNLMYLFSSFIYGSIIADNLTRTSAYKTDNLWVPTILRDICFESESSKVGRHIHYIELSRQIDMAAWDPRGIWVRVQVDIVRDYAKAISDRGRHEEFGSIELRRPEVGIIDRTVALARAIDAFAKLLDQRGGEEERVFHDFLRNHPFLLDVYGTPVSKPRWHYLEGESPLGKEWVEPDFVIRYHGMRYKLVELERPSKLLATAKGPPRSGVNEAAFQITEWRDYISRHYQILRNEFPDIHPDCPATVVISRSTQESVGPGRKIEDYKKLLSLNNKCRVEE